MKQGDSELLDLLNNEDSADEQVALQKPLPATSQRSSRRVGLHPPTTAVKELLSNLASRVQPGGYIAKNLSS